MQDFKKKLKLILTNDETQRYLRFFAIPLIAVILIIAILIVDEPMQATNTSDPETTVVESTQPSAESQPQAELPVYELQKENPPEIHTLMQAYLQARKDCDVQALNQVFGGAYSDEELAVKAAALEKDAGYYEDFQNLVCYTLPGIDAGEYVVYSSYDIKFRKAGTMAPTISVCYAKTAEDGSYYFEAESTDDTAGYIARMNQSKSVQLLASQVNSNLKAALESDVSLLRLYDELMLPESPTGSAGSEETSTADGSGESSDGSTAAGENSGGNTAAGENSSGNTATDENGAAAAAGDTP